MKGETKGRLRKSKKQKEKNVGNSWNDNTGQLVDDKLTGNE
jgi:hypothetical protein